MKHYRTLDIINEFDSRNEQGVRFTTIDLRGETTEDRGQTADFRHQTFQPPLNPSSLEENREQTASHNAAISMRFATLLMCLIFGILHAQGFTSFYSDHKSFSVGDILTVHISEQSKASSSAQSKTDRSTDHSTSIEPGLGKFSFVPMASMGGSSSHNFRGQANTTRDASLTSKMTVRIVDIDINGNLVIEGSRVVTINGEDETTTLHGIVRSQDVSSNNTVFSHNIADARISYTGKGDINTAQKPGLITRVLNWVF